MPTDLTIAMQMSLLAAGYAPRPEKKIDLPFPHLLQELLNYVNSPAYRQLEIDELNDVKTHE